MKAYNIVCIENFKMMKTLCFAVFVGFLTLNIFSQGFIMKVFDPANAPLSLKDYALLESYRNLRVKRNENTNFKYIYVNRNGSVSFQEGHIGTQIRVAGSPKSSMEAMTVSTKYISKIVKFMPLNIFRKLSSKASVGIFTAKEKLTIFPEYAYFTNGNCGSSCTGECSRTCTSDGRKIEDLAGIGGQRAVILDDNILCTQQDPYGHRENILTHEFAHTIHQFALDDQIKDMIRKSHSNALQHKLWNPTSYAMSNYLEYFAEGAAVFLGVNVYNRVNTGGMNMCGSSFCTTESAARDHLRTHDVSLYNILAHVFRSNRPQLLSGLTICPK